MSTDCRRHFYVRALHSICRFFNYFFIKNFLQKLDKTPGTDIIINARTGDVRIFYATSTKRPESWT